MAISRRSPKATSSFNLPARCGGKCPAGTPSLPRSGARRLSSLSKTTLFYRGPRAGGRKKQSRRVTFDVTVRLLVRGIARLRVPSPPPVNRRRIGIEQAKEQMILPDSIDPQIGAGIALFGKTSPFQ